MSNATIPPDPLEEALAVIDALGAPQHMSKERWAEFLGDLIDALETRRDEVERELEEQER